MTFTCFETSVGYKLQEMLQNSVVFGMKLKREKLQLYKTAIQNTSECYLNNMFA